MDCINIRNTREKELQNHTKQFLKGNLEGACCAIVLDISLDMSAPKPVEEHLPTVHSFPRPDPHTGSDPHDHVHQILDHENLELGPSVRAFALRTRYRVLLLAHVLRPRVHPRVEIDVLVEEARQHDEGGNGVEHGEDTYADHELLQLVRLGAVVFHDGADSEEGDEADEKADGSAKQVNTQGDQDEDEEGLHVVEAHVAHAAQDVTWKKTRIVRYCFYNYINNSRCL